LSNTYLSPRIIIEDLKAVWNYRALILNFAITDLKTRYRSTYLGYFWSLIEPLAFFGALYLIFTYAFPVRTENYALSLFIGIMLYHGFSRGTTQGMHSIISKGGVVGRVALPLEVAIVSTSLSSSISLLLDVGVFFAFMIASQFLPPSTIVFLPAILALEFVLILAVSLPLSVLTVYYKDLQYTWNVVTHLGFWLSPIAYRFELFPADIRFILGFNPIGGIIETSHWLVLGADKPPDFFLFYTIIIPFVILFWGYAIFKSYASKVVEEL
jgi:homopolymeric O-antigen transport system permease protein